MLHDYLFDDPDDPENNVSFHKKSLLQDNAAREWDVRYIESGLQLHALSVRLVHDAKSIVPWSRVTADRRMVKVTKAAVPSRTE